MTLTEYETRPQGSAAEEGEVNQPQPAWAPPPRRPLPKRRKGLDRLGWYEPKVQPVLSSTRQTEGYTWR